MAARAAVPRGVETGACGGTVAADQESGAKILVDHGAREWWNRMEHLGSSMSGPWKVPGTLKHTL